MIIQQIDIKQLSKQLEHLKHTKFRNMIKKIIFSILQYNVKNNKNEIMISLLTNSQIRKYDILTIQKF
jgi:hypothetical protein